MATAKATKKKASKKAKSPRTKKAIKTSSVDDFLNPTSVPDKPASSTSKAKSVSHFPTEPRPCDDVSLAEMMDQLAALDAVTNAALRKDAEIRPQIKKFLLEDFAQRWAKDGTRPDSRTWKGSRSNLDYVMTSRLAFTNEKKEEIEKELEIDMSDSFEISNFKINLKEIQAKPKHYEAFKQFLEVFATPEERNKIVKRELKLKSDTFKNLAQLCDQNPTKLFRILEILAPAASLKSIESSDKEEELFNQVRDMKG